jgi:hypothetical protein
LTTHFNLVLKLRVNGASTIFLNGVCKGLLPV